MNSSFNKYLPSKMLSILQHQMENLCCLLGWSDFLQNQSSSAPKPLIPFSEILKLPSSKGASSLVK